MTAIADSCAVIVFLTTQAPSVMPNAFPIMQTRDVFVPPIVVWEISRKVLRGKLPPLPIGGLPPILVGLGFKFLPMTWEIAADAETLPLHHTDPMDRIIIAHSRAARLPILTCDAAFPQYGVPVIW